MGWASIAAVCYLAGLPSMLTGGIRGSRPRVKGKAHDDSEPEAFVSDATSCDEEWDLRVDRDGVRVWRRHVPGSPFDEIRGNAILQCPPAQVLALLRRADEETIREYNPMYDSGYDLQQLDANTKVSYGAVRAIFPFKPRDTVTRVALRELPPPLGGTALLLRAVSHPDMPPRSTHVRAKILRGMHYVQPVMQRPSVTNFTFTQQVNAGGVLPAWLMNTLIAQDAVTFCHRLGAAASKRPKRSFPLPFAPPSWLEAWCDAWPPLWLQRAPFLPEPQAGASRAGGLPAA